ncbi:MAG: type II secretion system protein [Phycisphaerae bacterium]
MLAKPMGMNGVVPRRRYCLRASRLRAFTLIELLAVVAIIALLVSILVPSLKAARDMARKAVCQTNSRAIGTGINFYIVDNPDIVPPYRWAWHWHDSSAGEWTWDWADLIVKYCDSTARPTQGLGAQDYFSVGIQPADGNYVWDKWGVKVVYSKRFNCPAQKNEGKYHLMMNTTGPYWWYDYRYSSATAESWYRPHQLSEFKNPQRFCIVTEPSPTFGTGAGSFANEYITWRAGPDLAPRLPHFKTAQALMLDGHVELLKPLEMLNYYDGSRNDVFSTRGYPFFAR